MTNMFEGNTLSNKFLATPGSPRPELIKTLASKTVERKKLKPQRKTQPKQKTVTAMKDD